MSDLASARKFQLVAGNLALDFCNTVGGKRGVVEREYLSTFLDLAAWAQQAGVMSTAEAEQALKIAARRPEAAADVLARATELREALFRVFAALSAGKSAQESDLAILNRELSRALGRLHLAPGKRAEPFAWRWSVDNATLDHPLGPVAHAAASVLTDGSAVGRVRMCQGERCGWLFIDASKNHSRCWCDMRDCGNRAKVRRHRLKQLRQERHL
jgi:predicted RNA-binding Zn ribbon-like protein